MSFRAWCYCQQIDIAERLQQMEYAVKRLRMRRESEVGIARLWATVEQTSPYATSERVH